MRKCDESAFEFMRKCDESAFYSFVHKSAESAFHSLYVATPRARSPKEPNNFSSETMLELKRKEHVQSIFTQTYGSLTVNHTSTNAVPIVAG